MIRYDDKLPKNLFFALAFMLVGPFAFANTVETNSRDSYVNKTEFVTDSQQAYDAKEIVTNAEDVLIIILPDGTVIIIVTR
jgi:hypothetical protein